MFNIINGSRKETSNWPHHFFSTNESRNPDQGEDAVIERCGVVVVLQGGTEQLQQLAVVRLEGCGVGLYHLIQQQEANLFR